MMFDGLATVNIHNTGLIPWLNIVGPKYNISISWNLYNMLKADPTVSVYLVNEDPVMKKMIQEKEAAKTVKLTQEPAPVVVEEKKVEEVTEVKEAIEVFKVGEQIPLEGGEVEPYAEIAGLEEQQKLFDAMISNIDKEIEDKLAEVEEVVEEDDVIQPTEEDLIEINEHLSFKRYTAEELQLLTKAQLKEILNVERGFKPGDACYGGYHDNHSELVEFVLKSQ